MKTMKILVLIAIFVISAFQSYAKLSILPAQDTLSALKAGLFKNKNGDIFFRTIDKNAKGKSVETFIKTVSSTKFGKDKSRKMKGVIDEASFEALPASYYKDRNHIYYFKKSSEGGIMFIVDEADHDSFSAVENNVDFDARDHGHSYREGKVIPKQ